MTFGFSNKRKNKEIGKRTAKLFNKYLTIEERIKYKELNKKRIENINKTIKCMNMLLFLCSGCVACLIWLFLSKI